MKPVFSIMANGRDITSRLGDRLISLKMIDVAGWRSDEASFTLDMRDGKLPVPPLGALLNVELGYEDVPGPLKGTFKVDALEVSGFPAKLEIIARATDLLGQMKAPQSQTWHQRTIGSIVAEIAEKTNLIPAVSNELKDVLIPHIDQTAESFMHFLTRLARDYGAIFKVKDEKLVFVTAGTGISANGIALPAVGIRRRDILDYRYSGTGRNRFAGVKARWRNVPLNRDVVELAGIEGEDKAVKELTFPFPTQGEARAAAEAALRKLQRREEKLELTVIGNPKARAMFPLAVTGLGLPVDGDDWLIQRADHSYSRSGYITRLTCEKKNK